MTKELFVLWLYKRFKINENFYPPWPIKLVVIALFPIRAFRGWLTRTYDFMTDCFILDGVRIGRSTLLELKHSKHPCVVHNDRGRISICKTTMSEYHNQEAC